MNEQGYLDLVRRVLEEGEDREGRNGATKSLFGERLIFDLKSRFPLLTTKRVYWRGIVEELLWFLRGSTNVRELQEKGVHIWDGNSTREFLDSVGLKYVSEGSIGKGYGWQWRNFDGTIAYSPEDRMINHFIKTTDGVDQLRYILQELRDNPHGRRAVLCAWNPTQLREMALPPCHFVYNFYVGQRGLACQMVMRSCDVGAGLPFNIASTALLTHIISRVLGLSVDKIVIVTGDTHLYAQHFESAKAQIDRVPYELPQLVIKKAAPTKESSIDDLLTWIEELTYDDFEIREYTHHPPLKYEMVV